MTVKGPHEENYTDFFHNWTSVQKQQLQELLQALDSNMEEEELEKLVRDIVKHYEIYYDAKQSAARQSVLETMTPPWKTSLEKAFMWIGGWRPTMVFQLAYAEVGMSVEAELAEILEGADLPSMAALSAKQLENIDKLQRETVKEEDELSKQLAFLQQGMPDQPLLGLADQVQAALHADADEEFSTGELENAVEEKLKMLEDILIDADRLRKETLLKVLKILTTVQSAQYLAAAGKLQVAIRKVGEIQELKASEVDRTS